jgi:hypothetical protein
MVDQCSNFQLTSPELKACMPYSLDLNACLSILFLFDPTTWIVPMDRKYRTDVELANRLAEDEPEVADDDLKQESSHVEKRN